MGIESAVSPTKMERFRGKSGRAPCPGVSGLRRKSSLYPRRLCGRGCWMGGVLISGLSASYPRLALPLSLRLCFLAHSANGTHRRGLEGRGKGEVGVFPFFSVSRACISLLRSQASLLDPRPCSPSLLPSGEGGSLLCWPRAP